MLRLNPAVAAPDEVVAGRRGRYLVKDLGAAVRRVLLGRPDRWDLRKLNPLRARLAKHDVVDRGVVHERADRGIGAHRDGLVRELH